MEDKIGEVLSSMPGAIQIKLNGSDVFETNKARIRISKYISIEDGNNRKILASIQNISAVQSKDSETISYLVSCVPVGCYEETEDGILFWQGGINLPSPTEPAYLPEDATINGIFSGNKIFSFKLGTLSNNRFVNYYADGNRLFGKHIAVVGSTGSGKSCAVARLLQNVVNIDHGHNGNLGSLKNSHTIIFDIHSEYRTAFTLDEQEDFSLNCLDVEKLCLPYWLMNSQELESLFIESKELNSHNQISQFKKAVILSKEKHNPGMEHITYDTPVYFDINEVLNYIKNRNSEVINKAEGKEYLPKSSDGELIRDAENAYLEKIYSFAATSTGKADRATNGPYNGEFDRFITRLETKLADKRLKFITSPQKSDGSPYRTENFGDLLKQFLGYIEKSNITIIDLSAVPFEVLSIVVSLISRLIFDFAFHYSKLCQEHGKTNDIPFMLVCEEAHNYIPKSGGAEYAASRRSIERIAREGRKYGLSLMVVSQRPSEVSDTIFSQCSNFIVLKLTNVNDQSCIRNLLPDNNASLVDILPTLAAGECLAVGDAVPLPAVVKMDMPDPMPSSGDVRVYDEWNKDWMDVTFDDVVRRWRGE